MKWRGWSLEVDCNVQKSCILYFDSCKTCMTKARVVDSLIGVAKFRSENKENDREWFREYNYYLHSIYRLDYHCNKVHNKYRICKFESGAIPDWGRIIILNDCSQYDVNNKLDIVIAWHFCSYFYSYILYINCCYADLSFRC